jgi:hypothetical protein
MLASLVFLVQNLLTCRNDSNDVARRSRTARFLDLPERRGVEDGQGICWFPTAAYIDLHDLVNPN